jgi:hypothetical protein
MDRTEFEEQLARQQQLLDASDAEKAKKDQTISNLANDNKDLRDALEALQAQVLQLSQASGSAAGQGQTSAPSSSAGSSSYASGAPLTFSASAPAPGPSSTASAVLAANTIAVHPQVHMDLLSIPTFNGYTGDVSVEHFLKAFRSFVNINQTPPHLFRHILDSRTEGTANDFLHSLTALQVTNLTEIINAFKQEFKGGQYIITLDQRVANIIQNPGESVMAYYNRLDSAVRELKDNSVRHPGITDAAWKATWEDKTYSKFIGGLNQEVYNFVLARNPLKLKEAKAAALAGEASIIRAKMHTVHQVRSFSLDDVVHAVRLAEQESAPASASGGTKGPPWRPPTPYRSYPQSSSAPQSRSASPHSPSRGRRPTTCVICKQEGHWSRECPYRACGVCGQVGHLPYDCDQVRPKN